MSDRSEAVDHMHTLACGLLEEFRQGFLPNAREQYQLTLIARNEAYPDGSRDMIVTSDTASGMRCAIDFRFSSDDTSGGGLSRVVTGEKEASS